MRHITMLLIATTTLAAASPAAQPERQSRMTDVILAGGALPADLVHPEGRTRWDLTALRRGPSYVRTFDPVADGLSVAEACGPRTVFTDTDGVSVRRWLLPDGDREKLRPGTRETIDLYRARGSAEEHLRIETEIVGIGWVHLPSGPHEAVLQRATIEGAGGGDRTAWRWIDPRQGVVAEASGPAGPAPGGPLSIDSATVQEQSMLGAATLKLYVDDFDGPAYRQVTYGWDRINSSVASLVGGSDPNMTIGQVLAATTWNFSGNTSGTEIVSTTAPMNSSETCNLNSCGYNFAGAELDRDDLGFLDADPNNNWKNNSVTQREQRATDLTIWLRAGAQHEGVGGSLLNGESRFCYVTDGTGTRTQAPLYRFANQDPNGRWYMQLGDAPWKGGPGFNPADPNTPSSTCQQTIFNCVCGSCGGTLQTLWAGGNRPGCTNHSGTQGGGVVNTGVLTLPSGHTFNAMIVSNIADFCVWGGSGCGQFTVFSQVRTSNYLWQVPVLGTMVRVQSAQNPADTTSWTTAQETNIIFGLLPPRSINSTGSTTTSVSLSWDPGLDTHRISGYKIYWDTDSGSVSPYAFNSVANSGQVSFAGATATISGLTPGTTYYFTVTSLSDYTDPSSLITTRYESILYPTQVSGDPSFVYPTEVVQATAPLSCIPTTEVANVTVTVGAGGGYDICWDASGDPCLQGYEVLGANSPESDANFHALADIGTATCWNGNPAEGYFLVTVRGTGGNGPWGAFGH